MFIFVRGTGNRNRVPPKIPKNCWGRLKGGVQNRSWRVCEGPKTAGSLFFFVLGGSVAPKSVGRCRAKYQNCALDN